MTLCSLLYSLFPDSVKSALLTFLPVFFFPISPSYLDLETHKNNAHTSAHVLARGTSSNANEPCSNQISLPFGFVSRCKQKYIKKKLLSLDPDGQGEDLRPLRETKRRPLTSCDPRILMTAFSPFSFPSSFLFLSLSCYSA